MTRDGPSSWFFAFLVFLAVYLIGHELRGSPHFDSGMIILLFVVLPLILINIGIWVYKRIKGDSLN